MPPHSGKKIVIVKKKITAAAGHHGGSWKVAYADFVTAMMAFFMVMWILGMDEKTKQAIEGYFSNPSGYRKGYGAGQSPIATGTSPTNIQRTPLRMIVKSSEQKSFEKIREKILKKIEESDSLKKLKAHVEVEMTGDGLRIELVEQESGDVYFPSGSARMKPASVLALQLIGEELAQAPHNVVVEGHTDAAPFGAAGSYSNWELSSDRANAARRVLESSGVSRKRVVQVRGYADTKLRVVDNPLSPANRRISILLPYSNVPDTAISATDMANAMRDSLVGKIGKVPVRVPE